MTTTTRSLATTAILLLLAGGCGSHQKDQDRGFFTSGNRDADQRAEQRIAKDEQMNPQQNKNADSPADKNGGGGLLSASSDKRDKQTGAAKAPEKESLYDRLGGEKGVSKIVDDFVARALADPRVNWERKGVTRGGWSIHRNDSIEWKPTDAKVAEMKKHIAQFIAVATGGPTNYDGKEMRPAHAGMHITNAEFDATIGDLKATLDNQAVPTAEQKELLAIIESTRPQIVEER
jgi:hemoglobin